MPAVEIIGLRVELESHGTAVVEDVSFQMEAGEITGLAGESGSGKTTIANALTAHVRHGARIVAGSVMMDGTDLLRLTGKQLEAVRGSVVTFVPQDPSASLNPALRIGKQILEMFDSHVPPLPKQDQQNRIATMLREVGLPETREFLRRYPHQLSGGQEQRVLLAMAFLQRPRLVVMDEPTTGLDVAVQARILTMVRTLCRTHAAAVLYVTHDLAVLSELADQVIIAYAGRLVESGPRDSIFGEPAHPYTRELLAAIPDIAERRALRPIAGSAPALQERPSYCAFAPRCPISVTRCTEEQPALFTAGKQHVARCFRLAESSSSIISREPLAERASVAEDTALLVIDQVAASFGSRQVLADVSVQMAGGQTLALVGESGSGKTTLARVIMGLVQRDAGSVMYDGESLAPGFMSRSRKVRRELQYIYQSPYRSLNPRRTIGNSIRAPLELFAGVRGRELTREVSNALDRVAIPRSYIDRYPDQLSGGERQRVAIARALACNPRLLICDEVTSALDVSVQAAIVELLQTLQREADLALLFITHNLALVRSIADWVAVISEGRIVETGSGEAVLAHPQRPYTQTLIVNTPSIKRQRSDLGTPVQRATTA